jgi:hypothetical protein
MERTLTTEIRVRSASAMRIAEIDRLKFNEAVADGLYPCAPATKRGSVRLFNENDLVALYIFARLIDNGITPRMAGPLACEFAEEARLNPHEDRIIYVKSYGGMGTFLAGSQWNPDYLKHGGRTGLGQVVFALDFNVAEIRQVIAEAIEDERSIIGEDE